jgi:glutamine cyclotransferase
MSRRRWVFSIIILISGVIFWSCASPEVTYYKARVVTSFDHDYRAYVQGLELHDGLFWESTGQYGHSSLRVWDPGTGRKKQFKSLSKVFGEGMTLWKGKLYVLTWRAGICFVFDPGTFRELKQFKYTGEGWGLTHNNQFLIMSDGSDQLVFRDPETFEVVKRIHVTLRGKSVSLLNELEYDRGQIWANIYQSKTIVSIDSSNGEVTHVINLHNLPLDKDLTGTEEVLNGIAIDKATGKFFVTGKYWSKVYEIEFDSTDL